MATTAAMASSALQTPSQLQKCPVARSSAACPALASRTSVAFSGFNGSMLKANKVGGRLAISSSSRLSVKAAMEVDIGKIVPQADRVLIRLDALAPTSAGGVLLPSSAVKYDRFLQGEIIAAGSEVNEVEKGQRVMFADINAYEINLGTSDRLCFCRSGDLLAIVQ
ncbi:10 kDa chaperonin 1, chloroplastic [Physcomitrium patens]|uniref:Uncharacterized protein n=1 Tax=Physcomitrium patens TaxID=3218 RepID=A0A2K1L271_PHYPA|nr:10 kDa chaperonin 1, chloroplastic-like [Physcomitrium patens]PNR60127.1 hypothetical protein PHYPA_002920 [Physcomitrium patens]|eukprot:XP_024400153.1 10 kDa chaperonin 1, chloroplastic-like [Physcomitrella patens]